MQMSSIEKNALKKDICTRTYCICRYYLNVECLPDHSLATRAASADGETQSCTDLLCPRLQLLSCEWIITLWGRGSARAQFP